MTKCIYDKCKYVENFSIMPSWVRSIYLILSVVLMTQSYKNDLTFTTILILFTPLAFEYHYLNKSGEKSLRRCVFKIEAVFTKVVLLVAFSGKFDLFIIKDELFTVNFFIELLGTKSISLTFFWYTVALTSVFFALLDWRLISKPTRSFAS